MSQFSLADVAVIAFKSVIDVVEKAMKTHGDEAVICENPDADYSNDKIVKRVSATIDFTESGARIVHFDIDLTELEPNPFLLSSSSGLTISGLYKNGKVRDLNITPRNTTIENDEDY